MNILCITHRLPYPPNKGDKIRSFHQIWHLAKKHRVHVACLVDSPEDWQCLDALQGFCASVDAAYRQKTVALGHAACGLLSDKPLSVAAFSSHALRQKIMQRLREEHIDCILVCSSAMAGYVQHINHIPKIIDFMDVDSEKWRCYAHYSTFPLSALYRLEAKRLGRYEEMVARTFDQVIFTSDEEIRIFQKRVHNRPLAMISNGVDLDHFSPQHKRQDTAFSSEHTDIPNIVFIGVMDYFPNVDAVRYFCQEILPEVQKILPTVHFNIVGRNPVSAVKDLARLPHVTVTGGVPDVRPYLVVTSFFPPGFPRG